MVTPKKNWGQKIFWSEKQALPLLNSPFHVDSKNIHFVIIWYNFGQDIAEILQGSDFKS